MKSRMAAGLILVFTLVFSLVSSAAAGGSTSSDYEKHWASATIKKWIQNGWIHGYADGSFKPGASVKRGEYIAFVNRALGLKETAAAMPVFSDLSDKHWAYRDIAIADQAGYFKAGNGAAAPDRIVTREEAAVMLAGALKLQVGDNDTLSRFADADKIAAANKGAIAALAEKQVFKGDTKGMFNPKSPISRAEAVTAIDAALGVRGAAKVFDKAGEYGSASKTETIDGDVAIAASGVTLNNMVINGNLVLDKGIGEGDVYLKKVTVKGTTTIKGGGVNSIHLEDSVFLSVVVDKANGSVRIVAQGATSVQTVVVHTPVKIEESDVTDTGFRNIELSSGLPAGAQVELAGQFENVHVLAAGIRVNIPSGSIANLEVDKQAGKSTIDVSKEAKVLQLVLDAIVKMIGQGKIENATVNDGAKGSDFEVKPDNVGGAAKDSVTVTPPSSAGGGTGPGAGSGSNPGTNPGTNPGSRDTNAYLASITAGSFALTKRDENNQAAGTGFDPNTFGYSIATERDMETVIVPFTVTTASPYATVSYSVQYQDRTYEHSDYEITKSNPQFNVTVKPLEDVHMWIDVSSGDGKHIKSYNVDFQYKRTIQEAFRLFKFASYNSAGVYTTTYNLHSDVYPANSQLNVYTDNSKSNRLFPQTCTAPNYGSGNCFVQENDVVWPSGSKFYIEVRDKDGGIIDEGDYVYDFTALPKVTSDAGIDVTVLTTDEITARIRQQPWLANTSFIVDMQLDASKWSDPLLEKAKFSSRRINETRGAYPQSMPPTVESGKTSWQPRYFVQSRIGSGTSSELGPNWNGSLMNDQYFQIIFYDENSQPIAYYEKAIEFDDNHLLGAAAARNMHPVPADPNDSTPPVINMHMPSLIEQEEYVNLSLDEAGHVYFVPADSTADTLEGLVQAAQAGHGAGAESFLSEGGFWLPDLKVGTGEWKIVAVDKSGNLSLPVFLEVVAADSLPLRFTDIGLGYNYHVSIRFDRNIAANTDNLKSAITFSTDGGLTYTELGAEDTVYVNADSLEISFAEKYAGNGNRIKIAANTLKNAEGIALDKAVVSPSFAAGTVLTVTSAATMKVGDTVTFKVDKPETVYLVPAGTGGGEDVFDAAVAEGKGCKVVVGADQAGQELTISTDGLEVGNYLLLAWGGESSNVILTAN